MQNLITRLIINEDDNSRQAIAKELAEAGADGVRLVLDNLASGRHKRVLLLTLSRMISKEKCRVYLDGEWKRQHYASLIALSRDEDAKVRKSAYIIMGELKSPILKDALMTALKEESTLFLVSTIILALGNYGGEDTATALNAKMEEVKIIGVSPDNSKHIKDIETAYNKVINSIIEYARHTFNNLDKAYPIILTCPHGQPNAVREECKLNNIISNVRDNSVEVIAIDYPALFKVRTFSEALISPQELRNIPYVRNKIGAIISSLISIDSINMWHNGKPPYRYRIELQGENLNRKEDIMSLSEGIDKAYQGALINSPSDYEIEFRIIVSGDNCSVFIKPCAYKDNRFNYRINALPASIKGDVAAVCVRLVSKRLREFARVLDPFCGTGTMLIERSKLSSNLTLEGVDIYHEAIKKARENLNLANVNARLYSKDILEFDVRERYDEIISNMPYGLRVGTHKENELLYSGFIDKLPEMLSNKGIAILLTADYKLLKDLARKKGLKLLDEYVINSGGLLPHLFVLGK